MILTNERAEICVVGRCNFDSGIGMITYAFCEMFSRSFPTCVLPTEPELRELETITLPNGRSIPVCRDPGRIKASFFCDVLWNGVHDFNFALVPPNSLKYVYLVYDSDELPPRWTALLNEHFDVAVASSPHMIDVARKSLVETPIACLPLPLDLESMLSEGLPRRDRKRIRFGSVAAFHPRKGVLILLQAFIQLYAERDDVELVLHSNLAFGKTFDEVKDLIRRAGVTNVIVSHGALSRDEKNRLIKSFDVFASCSTGEGYSIGPREALAYGKALAISDVGGHLDLKGPPGVFMIEADVNFPARFPEIDNLVFGRQRAVQIDRAVEALTRAFDFARSDEYDRTVHARRRFAQNFSFTHLATSAAALIDPAIAAFRRGRSVPLHVSLPADFVTAVQAGLGRRAAVLTRVPSPRIVVAAHDGGFYSIFNAFMSHMLWAQMDDRCHAVLPDWDVDRFIHRAGDQRVMSFCYGRPGDGNLWLKLFQPLYDYTAEEMNDEAALYAGAQGPLIGGDHTREPLMTYIHAYKLYRTQWFSGWRRHYHGAFREHVHLRPELEAEIDAFAASHLGRRLLIAAHVRHPSHTVEQPGFAIAHTEAYVERIYAVLAARGIARDDPDWGVFLATDQESVVRRFRAEFGDRVACFDDVRRTRASEDAAFNALSKEEQNKEGHQLQHLVAASRINWSVRMAWEVVRDAHIMARCHVLLHVVSNVSTAVAYMNPEIEMIFCSQDANAADAAH